MIQENIDIESIYNHIKVLEERYKKNIKSHLFFPLADAYAKADMLDHAEAVLKEGLSNHPKYCAAKTLFGEVLFKKGNLQDAQQQLEEVVEMVPDNVTAHKLLIEVYKGIGLQDRCEKELNILKMIDQGQIPSFADIGRMETMRVETHIEATKGKKEIETFKSEEIKSVTTTESHEEENNEIITATLAELYFSQGFLNKSINIYKKLLIQQPDQEKWAKRLIEIQEIQNNLKNDSEIIPYKIQHAVAEDKKEKILAILEKWLKNCQDLKKSNT